MELTFVQAGQRGRTTTARLAHSTRYQVDASLVGVLHVKVQLYGPRDASLRERTYAVAYTGEAPTELEAVAALNRAFMDHGGVFEARLVQGEQSE
jgi:hypothetical protein